MPSAQSRWYEPRLPTPTNARRTTFPDEAVCPKPASDNAIPASDVAEIFRKLLRSTSLVMVSLLLIRRLRPCPLERVHCVVPVNLFQHGIRQSEAVQRPVVVEIEKD